MTDRGPAVRFTGHPPEEVIDCLAEVRDIHEAQCKPKPIRNNQHYDEILGLFLTHGGLEPDVAMWVAQREFK